LTGKFKNNVDVRKSIVCDAFFVSNERMIYGAEGDINHKRELDPDEAKRESNLAKADIKQFCDLFFDIEIAETINRNLRGKFLFNAETQSERLYFSTQKRTFFSPIFYFAEYLRIWRSRIVVRLTVKSQAISFFV